MKFRLVLMIVQLACLMLSSGRGLAVDRTAVSDPPPPPAATTKEDEPLDQLPFGAGTSYLLGTTMLEQGDFRGALPHLRQAYQLAPETREIARAYLSVLLGLGQRTDALAVLDGMLAGDPEDLELRRQKIGVLADLGRYEEALLQSEILRADGDDSSELLLLRVRLLAQAKRSEDALLECRRVLAEHPEQRQQVYTIMISLLEEQGARQDLLALYREACEALPQAHRLRFGWLRQLVAAGQLAEAEAVARQADKDLGDSAQEAGPSKPGAEFSWRLELADLFAQSGHLERAIAILDTMREEDQLGFEAGLWLARLYVSQSRPTEAIAILQEVVAQAPEAARARYFLGDLLAAQGELDAGESELRAAVRLDPRECDFQVSLVRLLAYRHGDALTRQPPTPDLDKVRQEILDLASKAVLLLPAGDHRGLMILGFALRTAGDHNKALKQFEAASELEPSRRDALLQLAITADMAGDISRARRALETVRRENPDDASVANSLGYFLAEKGQELERAQALIGEALAADPENGAYLDSLGWVYYQQKRFQEAFDQLVKAANVIPDDPIILEHLGRALVGVDQKEEALRVLRRARALGGSSDLLQQIISKLETELGEP